MTTLTRVFEALNLERRDGVNLLITVWIMTFFLFPFTEGAISDRIIEASIGGIASGAIFLIVTVLIYRYKPDHW